MVKEEVFDCGGGGSFGREVGRANVDGRDCNWSEEGDADGDANVLLEKEAVF